MSDIIILTPSPRIFSGEPRLVEPQQRQVQFRSSNNDSAVIQVKSKAGTEAELVAVDIAPDYSYSIPRRIENIADTPPLPLPPPDPKSYHLQARLAYEDAVSLWDPPKKILSISV